MKRIVALVLILCLCALCSCVSAPAPTDPTLTTGSTAATSSSTAESTQSTAGESTQSTAQSTAPTTEESEPAGSVSYATQPPVYGPSDSKPYVNPLTGEGLAEPFTNRIFAVSINNLKDALPHRGVYQADIYMEMFVNYSVIRGLALYSDIASVESIGSVRSTRPIFNMLAGHFDAFIAHAGYSNGTKQEQHIVGIDNMNIDTSTQTPYSYRDTERTGSWEHTLFAKGAGLLEKVASKGYRVTNEAGKTYGMTFTQDGTPANGEKATNITITFRYKTSAKQTTMVYNSNIDRYVYNQYGMVMADADTNTLEAFQNVIVLFCKDQMDSEGYHIYDLLAGGEGYFACGGKIIPIAWTCTGSNQPFVYTTSDGQPLDLGVGNTYIALTPVGSTVDY